MNVLPHTLSSNIHGDGETEEGGETGTVRQKVTGMGKKQPKEQRQKEKKGEQVSHKNKREMGVCVSVQSFSQL